MTVYFLVPVCRYHLMFILYNLFLLCIQYAYHNIIVRLFNSDAKRNVMRAKKNLKNNVRFVDDITKQNHELMKRMRDSNRFVYQ
jgi:hypothetical protein